MKYGLYHGCHNTFVITDDVSDEDLSTLAIELCQKHQTDGFIVAKKEPLEMIFFNADGSTAPMCGNGLRCLIRFCYEQNYFNEDSQIVITQGGLMKTKITAKEPFTVLVNLGKPSYQAEKLNLKSSKEQFNEPFIINNESINISALFLGTHHAVVFLDDLAKAKSLGEIICHHPFYQKQINVNFVKIIDRNNIIVDTYERGVGWTLACGTGGSSSVAVAYRLGLVNNKVIVHFTDGKINVEVNEEGEILMEGPAERSAWFSN